MLPASHKALRRALDAEAKSYHGRVAALDKRVRGEVNAAAAASAGDTSDEVRDDLDDD